jgi:glyoxylase-like metal-dependent hydrolase (beta-lactamase superfamily II)
MTPRIERVEGTVMAVNSYLVHGPGGMIVVDGQLTISDARAVHEAAGRAGQAVAGIVVTHPHPDHYAGAGLIGPPDVPILATAAVANVIRRDDGLKDTIVGPMMGEQWPTRRRFPDQIVEPGSTLSLVGLQLAVHDAGPGESHADTVWSIGNRWFIGDLLCPHMDAYLADGHYRTWLASLDWLRDNAPAEAIFYPGHGAPAGHEAIARQRAYIEAFIDAVRNNLGADAGQRRDAVLARTRPLVSDHRLQFLAELSIEPVATAVRATAAATLT